MFQDNSYDFDRRDTWWSNLDRCKSNDFRQKAWGEIHKTFEWIKMFIPSTHCDSKIVSYDVCVRHVMHGKTSQHLVNMITRQHCCPHTKCPCFSAHVNLFSDLYEQRFIHDWRSSEGWSFITCEGGGGGGGGGVFAGWGGGVTFQKLAACGGPSLNSWHPLGGSFIVEISRLYGHRDGLCCGTDQTGVTFEKFLTHF